MRPDAETRAWIGSSVATASSKRPREVASSPRAMRALSAMSWIRSAWQAVEDGSDVLAAGVVATLQRVDRREGDAVDGDQEVHLDRLCETERVARERPRAPEVAEGELEDREDALAVGDA